MMKMFVETSRDLPGCLPALQAAARCSSLGFAVLRLRTCSSQEVVCVLWMCFLCSQSPG